MYGHMCPLLASYLVLQWPQVDSITTGRFLLRLNILIKLASDTPGSSSCIMLPDTDSVTKGKEVQSRLSLFIYYWLIAHVTHSLLPIEGKLSLLSMARVTIVRKTVATLYVTGSMSQTQVATMVRSSQRGWHNVVSIGKSSEELPACYAITTDAAHALVTLVQLFYRNLRSHE